MINGSARRGSNMFENYSEEDYDTYNALREQSIKPNIARMTELGEHCCQVRLYMILFYLHGF